MKKQVLAGALMAAAAVVAAPIELHVSPAGNDSNPGTKEKPLATPAGARDALRRMRAAVADAQERVPPAEVVFEDGVYLLSEPVRLDARDGSNVTWRAANRGKAVFSGALTPAGWKKVDDPAILELLPETARGHVLMADIPQGLDLPGFRGGGCGTPAHLQEIPLSLFQGERRLESARWPNEGFVRTGDNVGKMEKRHDATYSRSGVFKFASPRLAQWAKEPELWTYGLWCYEWADAKARVLAIDPSAGTISVDPSPIGFGIRENAQFHVLNALSEIDRPGEWVIDRAARRVYLWPVGSEPIRFAAAPGLVDVRDVTDITFDGFVFEYVRTTAVRFNNSVRAKVLSSVFRHTSSWGVKVARGTDCRVEGCDMYDLGEGGVSLEGGDFKTLTPGNNVADNNHIHHYGLVVPNYRPGVQLDGVGNRCTHNLIHHTLHQAVAFGGNDHVIGFNVCHDCCTFNDDAGTIYCCQRDWSKRGTVIEHNIIHMTGKQPRATHTEAIYLDDYSSGVTVRGNIINRASYGVYIGGGQDCDVYGNVIMNCGAAISLGSRGIETFARGISSKGRESGMFKRLERNRALFEGPLWKSRYPNMMRVFDFPDAQHAHDAHFNRITNNGDRPGPRLRGLRALRVGPEARPCARHGGRAAFRGNRPLRQPPPRLARREVRRRRHAAASAPPRIRSCGRARGPAFHRQGASRRRHADRRTDPPLRHTRLGPRQAHRRLLRTGIGHLARIRVRVHAHVRRHARRRDDGRAGREDALRRLPRRGRRTQERRVRVVRGMGRSASEQERLPRADVQPGEALGDHYGGRGRRSRRRRR